MINGNINVSTLSRIVNYFFSLISSRLHINGAIRAINKVNSDKIFVLLSIAPNSAKPVENYKYSE